MCVFTDLLYAEFLQTLLDIHLITDLFGRVCGLTGLSVFLASCNHQEDWVGLAEMRARQYSQLAELLLGYIPQYAQSETSHAFSLTLKYLATHHFSVSTPNTCYQSGYSPTLSTFIELIMVLEKTCKNPVIAFSVFSIPQVSQSPSVAPYMWNKVSAKFWRVLYVVANKFYVS